MATIALSGCHGSGKSTLAMQVVAELKIRGINAGLVSESARGSHYLIDGKKSPEMHMEILALHIVNETRARRIYDIVVCDRSVFDFLTYARLRFKNATKGNIFIDSISSLASTYGQIYDHIFMTVHPYGNPEKDHFRSNETLNFKQFTETHRTVIKELYGPAVELNATHDANYVVDYIVG